jgi:hypothetical protein
VSKDIESKDTESNRTDRKLNYLRMLCNGDEELLFHLLHRLILHKVIQERLTKLKK